MNARILSLAPHSASDADLPQWAERAIERSPGVRRTPERSLEQARAIVEAAKRLLDVNGTEFTTQELVNEAGVSLQTFYKAFESKDELFLALLEDLIASSCVDYQKATESLAPLERLRRFISIAVVDEAGGGFSPRFTTSEHWRLMQIYPAEIEAATTPYTDLVELAIKDAMAEGLLKVASPRDSAWLITQLVMSVFHHGAFSGIAGVDEARLWSFCSAALGVH